MFMLIMSMTLPDGFRVIHNSKTLNYLYLDEQSISFVKGDKFPISVATDYHRVLKMITKIVISIVAD